VAGADLVGGPQYNQCVDEAGERGGAAHRAGGLVLRVLEAERLLAVEERDLNTPARLPVKQER